MKNILFSIGPFDVHGYGLMIAIGVLAAYYMTEYRAKKRGMDYEKIFSLAIWAVAGGFLGAKLLYLITRFGDIIQNPEIFWDSMANGFVVYGGIIGGILGAWIFCRIKKLPFLKLFDLVVPALALAQGFGRIGCHLAGCCYGMQVEDSCPIAVVFPEGNGFAPAGVPLLPTQLISSVLDFLHFGLLMLLSRKLKSDGQLAACYLIFYSIGRFILEFFRGDLIRGSVGTLSTSQFISIFIFLAGAIMFLLCSRAGKKKEISQPQED